MLLAGSALFHPAMLVTPVRAHIIRTVMVLQPEPLCDGCYFRCSACAYVWDDEDFLEDGGPPLALVRRDAERRLELGMELEPQHASALGGSSDGEAPEAADVDGEKKSS